MKCQATSKPTFFLVEISLNNNSTEPLQVCISTNQQLTLKKQTNDFRRESIKIYHNLLITSSNLGVGILLTQGCYPLWMSPFHMEPFPFLSPVPNF